MQETLEPSPEPIKPELIEYSLSRSLDENLVPHFFDEMDDLKAVITGNTFKGKWLIFVSSKQAGRELHTQLKMHFKDSKKIVFADADYGLKGHEKAMEEVSDFACKIFIVNDSSFCT